MTPVSRYHVRSVVLADLGTAPAGRLSGIPTELIVWIPCDCCPSVPHVFTRTPRPLVTPQLLSSADKFTYCWQGLAVNSLE
jgi:hypothetical protein